MVTTRGAAGVVATVVVVVDGRVLTVVGVTSVDRVVSDVVAAVVVAVSTAGAGAAAAGLLALDPVAKLAKEARAVAKTTPDAASTNGARAPGRRASGVSLSGRIGPSITSSPRVLRRVAASQISRYGRSGWPKRPWRPRMARHRARRQILLLTADHSVADCARRRVRQDGVRGVGRPT